MAVNIDRALLVSLSATGHDSTVEHCREEGIGSTKKLNKLAYTIQYLKKLGDETAHTARPQDLPYTMGIVENTFHFGYTYQPHQRYTNTLSGLGNYGHEVLQTLRCNYDDILSGSLGDEHWRDETARDVRSGPADGFARYLLNTRTDS